MATLADPELWRHVCQSMLSSTFQNLSTRKKKRLAHCEMANRGYDVVVDVDEGVNSLLNGSFNSWMLNSSQRAI